MANRDQNKIIVVVFGFAEYNFGFNPDSLEFLEENPNFKNFEIQVDELVIVNYYWRSIQPKCHFAELLDWSETNPEDREQDYF